MAIALQRHEKIAHAVCRGSPKSEPEHKNTPLQVLLAISIFEFLLRYLDANATCSQNRCKNHTTFDTTENGKLLCLCWCERIEGRTLQTTTRSTKQTRPAKHQAHAVIIIALQKICQTVISKRSRSGCFCDNLDDQDSPILR